MIQYLESKNKDEKKEYTMSRFDVDFAFYNSCTAFSFLYWTI